METVNEQYLVRKIAKDRKEHPCFTLDIDGVVRLLKMMSTGICKFEIEKIS